MNQKSRKAIAHCLLIFFTYSLFGCSTAWEDSGFYYRTKQTELLIEGRPPSKVYINNEYTGNSPIATYLEYEQKINKKTRKVSYWTTQPASAFLLSIVSLGLYIPFSVIPVDIETSLIMTDSFKANEFSILLKAKGYKDWQKKIECVGQDELALQYELQKIAEEEYDKAF